MTISFREFLELDKETQMALGNMNMNEELSVSVKKKKMRELETLLKKHDFLYQYMDGDYREWRRQNDMAQDIRKLKDLIGDDARALYKIYAKKGGDWTESNTKPTAPDKVDEVKKPSLFPEMDNVERNISLGVDINENGYVLPNGGHHFADTPFDTTTKWQPPKKRNKYV
jgi:hypothetical protein